MKISPEKFKIMHLGNQLNPEDYFIGCSRLVWWNMIQTSQLCSIQSQPYSRIDEEHIYLMVRWNSKNYLSNIRHAILGVCFISMQPLTRIRLKDIRNCPAESHPHERIKSSILWKETRKTWFDWPEKRWERGDFIQILQDRARSREGKLVQQKQNTKTIPKFNGPKTSLSAFPSSLFSCKYFAYLRSTYLKKEWSTILTFTLIPKLIKISLKCSLRLAMSF